MLTEIDLNVTGYRYVYEQCTTQVDYVHAGSKGGEEGGTVEPGPPRTPCKPNDINTRFVYSAQHKGSRSIDDDGRDRSKAASATLSEQMVLGGGPI